MTFCKVLYQLLLDPARALQGSCPIFKKNGSQFDFDGGLEHALAKYFLKRDRLPGPPFFADSVERPTFSSRQSMFWGIVPNQLASITQTKDEEAMYYSCWAGVLNSLTHLRVMFAVEDKASVPDRREPDE